MTDVWTGYLDQLGGRLKLLVEPWDETAAADVAKYLRKAMGPAFGETRTVYNRTNVATELTLDELIAYGLPLTWWYANLAESAAQEQRAGRQAATPRDGFRLPRKDEVWEDVLRPSHPAYPWPALLPTIRIAGIVGHLEADQSDKRRNAVWRNVVRLRRLGEQGLGQKPGSDRRENGDAPAKIGVLWFNSFEHLLDEPIAEGTTAQVTAAVGALLPHVKNKWDQKVLASVP